MSKKRKIDNDNEFDESQRSIKKVKKSLKSEINGEKIIKSNKRKVKISNEKKSLKPKEKKLVSSKEFFARKNKRPKNVLKSNIDKHKVKNDQARSITDSEKNIKSKEKKSNKLGKAITMSKLNGNEFKDRKKIRRMRSSVFEIAATCKKLWEEFRKYNIEPKKRLSIASEIFSLIRGKCLAIIRAHDTSRVVQSMIKYGTQEQRDEIYLELHDDIITMAKSKYAKFCVKKFIKYSSKDHRNEIILTLANNIILLMRYKDGSEVVEYAYNFFANASQRAIMIEPFFGPRFHLERMDQDDTLATFLSNHPESITFVLNFFKESLTALIEKNILEKSFVHKLFFEFLSNSTGAIRAELIESMRDNFVHMLHTREGARATMHAIWHGTSKDRKAIIKSFKTFVRKIFCEEYGHLVLLALFDSVDDTKIVQKIIIDEMLKDLDTVATDSYGRKALLYLLCPRNPNHFHPNIVELLKLGDNNRNSKKEKSLRWDELSNYVSNYLVEYVAENIRRLATDNNDLLFAVNTLMYAKGDSSKGLKALCEMVCEKFEGSTGERGFHLIDSSAGHFLLKKLVENDAKKLAIENPCLFSTTLIDMLNESTIKSWLNCNRGCFLIVTLLKLKIDKVTKSIKQKLSGCNTLLKKLNTPGSNVLLKKLTEP